MTLSRIAVVFKISCQFIIFELYRSGGPHPWLVADLSGPYERRPALRPTLQTMPSSTTTKNAPSATQSKRPFKKARIEEKVSKVPSKKSKSTSKAVVSAPANGKGKGKARAPTPPASLSSTILQNKVDDSKPSPLPQTFKIVAGTYEKLLYGLEGTISTPSSSSQELTFNLKPIFIFPAHVSCVKAVAASPEGGKWLATGSADEIIKVWDLRRKREIGGLMHHTGAPPLSST